jgi:hypothetical protein
MGCTLPSPTRRDHLIVIYSNPDYYPPTIELRLSTAHARDTCWAAEHAGVKTRDFERFALNASSAASGCTDMWNRAGATWMARKRRLRNHATD